MLCKLWNFWIVSLLAESDGFVDVKIRFSMPSGSQYFHTSFRLARSSMELYQSIQSLRALSIGRL